MKRFSFPLPNIIFLKLFCSAIIFGSLGYGDSPIYDLNQTHYQELSDDAFDNAHSFFGSEVKSFAIIQTLEANQTISVSLDRVIFDSNASVWGLSTDSNASFLIQAKSSV